MKKKLITMLGSVCLILVLAALLLPACAPRVVEAPELEEKIAELEKKLALEKAEVSKLEKELAEAKEPAKVIKWKFQVSMPSGSLSYQIEEDLVDRIQKATGGRLELTQYSGGSLTPLYETLEAIGSGGLEMAEAYGTAYSGTIPEGGMIKEQAYGIQRADTYYRLIHVYGWAEIYSDLLAEHNARLISMMMYPGFEPVRMTVPIRSYKDYKGKKVRMGSGIGPFYEKYFDVSVVTMAGGELYTACQLGTIDGFEYASGKMDWDQGFHEAARYIIYPAWDGPCEQDIIANMDAYNALPDDIKEILHRVCDDWSVDSWWAIQYEADNEATQMMADYGNEIIWLPDDEVAQIKVWAKEYRVEQAAKISPTCVKLFEIYEKLVDEEEALAFGGK